jgi:small conductance mechanosensitive channel
MDWTPVIDWLLEHGTRILIILVVGAVLWFVLKKALPLMVRHTLVRISGERETALQKRRDTLIGVFWGTARIVIIVIVVFMILSEIGIEIAPILAGFGIAGLAVGFGAQYLIRDLIAGIFVLLENQYRIGDVVRIADVAGLVEEIHLRKTVLRDLDGIVHHVPNGEVPSTFHQHN